METIIKVDCPYSHNCEIHRDPKTEGQWVTCDNECVNPNVSCPHCDQAKVITVYGPRGVHRIPPRDDSKLKILCVGVATQMDLVLEQKKPVTTNPLYIDFMTEDWRLPRS